ncbi:MAG: purine-nucleoside phosphorylase [Desulfuromonadaceae bacterium]
MPGFPAAQIEGHAGCLLGGRFQGWNILLFQGRYHLYQGLDARQVTVPVTLAHALGCRRLLLTNASGGISEALNPGDFMFVADHINLLGDNPLRGEVVNPFVDLSRLYHRALFDPLQDWARQQEMVLRQGVLAALPGPSYETPAEIRMLQRLGADAVSMSTIPEAIMGKYLGMEVVALALIANKAAGFSSSPLEHQEVLQAGIRSSADFLRLVRRLIGLWQG